MYIGIYRRQTVADGIELKSHSISVLNDISKVEHL